MATTGRYIARRDSQGWDEAIEVRAELPIDAVRAAATAMGISGAMFGFRREGESQYGAVIDDHRIHVIAQAD